MQIKTERFGDKLLVILKGELDHHFTEELRKKIDRELYNSRLKNIIIDLREITFMDSSGLGLIMGRYKVSNDLGGKVDLIISNEYIEKIIRMSGILKIVDVYKSLDEIK